MDCAAIKRIVKQNTGLHFAVEVTCLNSSRRNTLSCTMSAPSKTSSIKIAYESRGPRAGSIITRLCRVTCPQPASRSSSLLLPGIFPWISQFLRKPDLSPEHRSRMKARTSHAAAVQASGQVGSGVDAGSSGWLFPPPASHRSHPHHVGSPVPHQHPPQGAAGGQSDSQRSATETLQRATPSSGPKSFLAFKSMTNGF